MKMISHNLQRCHVVLVNISCYRFNHVTSKELRHKQRAVTAELAIGEWSHTRETFPRSYKIR